MHGLQTLKHINEQASDIRARRAIAEMVNKREEAKLKKGCVSGRCPSVRPAK